MGTSQKRAIENYRSRLAARGLTRFEVPGLSAGRALIRSLARRLADGGAEAAQVRAAVRATISGAAPGAGGVLAALRRSALAGADLDLSRPRVEERVVDL